ncbi:MAG: response regulator [Cyclobacteriaceae bacterium]|jgi:two-component system chemotaxis response regulator CheY|nr:response regulator [Flammeovirgaceae bacterium]MCZ8023243.1 response regulator [Cytophagales bacterium]MCZ8329447.1 response regulator [Cyclobacteriaceae bacterium]
MSAPVIALIDDDEVFQLTSSRMLRAINPDVTVKQFANGGVALSFFAEQAENAEELPDIILLDINMPYVDGWMFLQDFEKIRESLVKIPTIFMVSSSIDPTDISKAKSNEQVLDYLIKPISKAKFEVLINQ